MIKSKSVTILEPTSKEIQNSGHINKLNITNDSDQIITTNPSFENERISDQNSNQKVLENKSQVTQIIETNDNTSINESSIELNSPTCNLIPSNSSIPNFNKTNKPLTSSLRNTSHKRVKSTTFADDSQVHTHDNSEHSHDNEHKALENKQLNYHNHQHDLKKEHHVLEKMKSFTVTPEYLSTFESLYPTNFFNHSESLCASVSVQSKDKHQESLKTRYRFIKQEHATRTIICIHGLISNLNSWNILCGSILANSSEDTILNEEYNSDHSEKSVKSDSTGETSDRFTQSHSSSKLISTSLLDDSLNSYNILTYDTFNSGESSQIPQAVPQIYVNQLLELLRHLNLIPNIEDNSPPNRSLVLIGHSQGGAIALHFTNQFSDLVSKLVLCAPGGFLKSLPFPVRYARVPLVSDLLFFGMKKAFSYEMLIHRGFFGTQHRDLLVNLVKAQSPEIVVHAMESTLRYFQVQGSEYLIDWLVDYQKANPGKMEILIGWGIYDHDAPCSEIFPWMEEKLRFMNSSFFLFDHTRHSFTFERGEDFAKVIIGFLKEKSIINIKEEMEEYKPNVVPTKKDLKVGSLLRKKYSSYIL